MCRADCRFCLAPDRDIDRLSTPFGDDPSAVLRHLSSHPFDGISFSGGEPFLVFDRLMEWLQFFRRRRPDIYYWTYTSGIDVSEVQLTRLAAAGCDEIRFNIAATNYSCRRVLDAITVAAKVFPTVTVEIPSIPEDQERVLSVLPALDRAGVRFLNLHEYILRPTDDPLPDESRGTFRLNFTSTLDYDRRSRENTERIRRFCRESSLRMRVHHCSLRRKERQMRQRRLVMGRILRAEHERLTSDGLLETVVVYPGSVSEKLLTSIMQQREGLRQLTPYFVHPDSSVATSVHPATVASAFFLPPLSLREERTLVRLRLREPE